MCYWFFPHICLNYFIYFTVYLSFHFICCNSKFYLILWIIFFYLSVSIIYLFSSLYLKNLYFFHLNCHFTIPFFSLTIFRMIFQLKSRIPLLLLHIFPTQALVLAFSSALTPLILFIALIAFSAFLVACITPNHIQVLT